MAYKGAPVVGSLTQPESVPPSLAAGMTVRDLARRYRVSKDKVRTWIKRGELSAINTATALYGKPRWIVTADALAAFERRRASGPPPAPKRKPRKTVAVDYFPD